jgi:hypothetical protein
MDLGSEEKFFWCGIGESGAVNIERAGVDRAVLGAILSVEALR